MQSSSTLFAKPNCPLSEIQAAMENIINETDPYIILNIRKRANEKEIDMAYKVLALKYHPDKQTDPKLKELANDATTKLNQVRKQAKELCQSTDKKPKHESVDVVDQFTVRMTNIAISSVWDVKTRKNVKLLHSFNEYNLGLAMLWTASLLKNQQAEVLKLIDAGLRYEPVTSDVLKLAEEIHPYVKNKIVLKTHRNNIATILAHDSPMTELNVGADIDISWNFDPTQTLEMLYDISIHYSGTPIIIHNATFNSKISSYIGLYSHERDFYLFNPNQLELNSDKTSLQRLTWQEVSERIASIFFQSEGRLLNANNKLSQPISIVTLRSNHKAIKNKTNEVVSITQSTILNTVIQSTEFNAEEILQNIADFQFEDNLDIFYKTKPMSFSPELLARFLRVSLNTDNVVLALEICKLDYHQQSGPFRWSCQYINDYLSLGRPLKQLPDILLRFKQVGLDLVSLVTNETKQNGSPALANCDKKTDPLELDTMLTLGIIMKDTQREKLIAELADEIHKFAKYHEYIQPCITIYNVLAKHNISLTPGDGLPITSHPYYSLMKANKLDIAKRFYELGLIDLNKTDKKGKTLVNHLTNDKEWEEVKLLLKSGAIYSTGQDISAEMIPPIAAYFKNAHELRELYTGDQFALMLKLETDVGDILCAAISAGKIVLIPEILKNGFRDKLRANPIHYLYHCLNPEIAKLLLTQLAPNYLEYSSAAVTLPLTVDQFIKVTNIACNEDAFNYEGVELLGISRHIIDSYIKQLGIKNLKKFEVLGSNDVYYSADEALTKKLYTNLSIQVVQKCYDSIMEHILKLQAGSIPNISFLLNELVKIYKMFRNFQQVESLERLEFRLENHHSKNTALIVDKYTDNKAVLNYIPRSIGIKISFDENNIAKSYCMINNLALYVLEEFIDVETKVRSDDKFSDLGQLIRSTGLQLYQLKAILEETLEATFEHIEPFPDNYARYSCISSYETFRRELSPNKNFPDVNLDFKIPKISEHIRVLCKNPQNCLI